MTKKMSLAGKRAALSKIQEFANSTDENLRRKYGPQAEKLEKEIAAILEANPELARTKSARKRASGDSANPRRTMAAKVAWVTMNRRKLEAATDDAEKAEIQSAIDQLENDIAEIRRLFPEVDTPVSRGGGEIVDREATMALFKQFASEFDDAFQRILGIAPAPQPAAPVVEQPAVDATTVAEPAAMDEPKKHVPIVTGPDGQAVYNPPAKPEPKQAEPAKNAKQRRAERRQDKKAA